MRLRRALSAGMSTGIVFFVLLFLTTFSPRWLVAQGRVPEARAVLASLADISEDGFCFRVDTRLRPFGDSGPPVVSFAALESYLLQHGRDWERYAYVKARVVGPDPGEAVVRDLYDNLIRPFVYRRYIDYGVFQSLRDMHALIAAEVKTRELHEKFVEKRNIG